MEWVMKWATQGMGMYLYDGDVYVAMYKSNTGYWEIRFMDAAIDKKIEYTRVDEMREDEVQKYIEMKYKLLRGG